MRQFYCAYPIRDTLCPELSWSHYRLLMRIPNEKERAFYAEECAKSAWSVRQLERQIHTMYYQRILASQDKSLVAAEIQTTEPKPEYEKIIKDPYVMEFLQIRPDTHVYEGELEQALIDHLQLWRLSLSAKELISSDALIFLRRNGGEAMKYECLKLEERRIIEEMYAKGAKPGEIAERVGKCQATIYRELERGKTGETDSRFRQGYSAAVAEARVNRSYRNRGRRKAAQ